MHGDGCEGRCHDPFIGLKRGLFTADGPEFSGEVLFSDLDTPADIQAGVSADARLVEPAQVMQNLRRPPRHAHKGRYGHVLVIGGDYGYLGAAILAGSAAARTGAGLVTMATRTEHARNIPLYRPELMTAAVDTAQDLDAVLSRASMSPSDRGWGNQTGQFRCLQRYCRPGCLWWWMPTPEPAGAGTPAPGELGADTSSG